MKRSFVKAAALALALLTLLASVACGKEEQAYVGVTDYAISSDMVLRLNAETSQASLDALKVGDIVTLGTYDMDNDPENGKESITWKVLAIENGKALIISEICVDAAKYNAQKGEVTWETSDIRAQLNDENESFYATAFDEGEKEYILSSTIKNSDNAYHDSEGGNDTEDRVFLLSFDEAEQYFNSDEDRIAKASMAAIANGGECFDSRTKSQRRTRRYVFSLGQNLFHCV